MIGTKKPRGSPISSEQLESLRASYLAGATIGSAADAARVSASTAYNKFHSFELAGLTRGKVIRKNAGRLWSASTLANCRYPLSWQLPRYSGPTWIGKRITVDSDSRI